ncbi:hypothetical protein SDC9_52387 [bioreactor metagenome]|uniref:Uncharacterized protein n=1 Tax=bioreactor metagenome TaxID=1076179 RepID=A0A644WRE7_9ZZZZ
MLIQFMEKRESFVLNVRTFLNVAFCVTSNESGPRSVNGRYISEARSDEVFLSQEKALRFENFDTSFPVNFSFLSISAGKTAMLPISCDEKTLI